MKIYIVTSGEYSDYGINAVFLEKEKAEKYCEIQNKLQENTYPCYFDEWETQDDKVNIQTKIVKYYYCVIDLKTSKIDEPEIDIETEQAENKIYTRDTYWEECKYCNTITAYSINSYEQAKKIAIEQYQLHTQRKLEEQC